MCIVKDSRARAKGLELERGIWLQLGVEVNDR